MLFPHRAEKSRRQLYRLFVLQKPLTSLPHVITFIIFALILDIFFNIFFLSQLLLMMLIHSLLRSISLKRPPRDKNPEKYGCQINNNRDNVIVFMDYVSRFIMPHLLLKLKIMQMKI